MKYHKLHLSETDYGDDLRILVCYECSRSVSVKSTKSGAMLWATREVINQGDFYVLHEYATPGMELTIEHDED